MKVWILICPPSDCVDRHGQVTSYLSLNIFKKSIIQIILCHMIAINISDNIGEGNEKVPVYKHSIWLWVKHWEYMDGDKSFLSQGKETGDKLWAQRSEGGCISNIATITHPLTLSLNWRLLAISNIPSTQERKVKKR